MRRLIPVTVGLVLPLAASCYSFNAPATVRARHAIETQCPDDQITVVELGDSHYRASGCGQRGQYECHPRSAGSEEWDCRPEEEQDAETVFGHTEGGEGVRDSAHMDAGVAADGGVADGGGVRVPDAGGAATAGGADAGAAPAADPTATVRAAIDAHGADVLGCTGRSSIGVHASWTANGTVTFALPGDLAGRPEESCVRTAIGPVTVAGPAGELMQLVRR